MASRADAVRRSAGTARVAISRLTDTRRSTARRLRPPTPASTMITSAEVRKIFEPSRMLSQPFRLIVVGAALPSASGARVDRRASSKRYAVARYDRRQRQRRYSRSRWLDQIEAVPPWKTRTSQPKGTSTATTIRHPRPHACAFIGTPARLSPLTPAMVSVPGQDRETKGAEFRRAPLVRTLLARDLDGRGASELSLEVLVEFLSVRGGDDQIPLARRYIGRRYIGLLAGLADGLGPEHGPMRCALPTVPRSVRGVTEDRTAERAAWISRGGRPQLPHELVERALAPWIAGEPNAPQDFGAREVG